ncbi:MAG: hypothetical protein ACRDP7_13485 [Trebonia sp.]
MLAEPAGQGLGCDGPCGRAAGEERAGARAAGGGGGVELGADEGGEPGREENRDSIDPQARVGAVLLDVGVGEPGQARDELAVEQQERSGGPDVERDARVAQACARSLKIRMTATFKMSTGNRCIPGARSSADVRRGGVLLSVTRFAPPVAPSWAW